MEDGVTGQQRDVAKPEHASEELQDAALANLWMPTQSWSDLAESGVPIMAEGDGVKIRDVHGRWGYDGSAGLMLINIGHGRTEVIDAIAAQLGTLHYASTFRYATEPVVRFAEKVASLTPGDLNHVYFTSGGSEAVDTALKVAYQYHANRGEPRRIKFIARQDAYHGISGGALSVSTAPFVSRSTYEPLLPRNVRIAPQPLYYRREDDAESLTDFTVRCATAIDDIIRAEGPETVAAVIAEPVCFSAGVAIPGDEYWPMLREICDRHGVLLIADEVITGWGRTGKWFGVEHWGVVPDLMTMAKGITSGYFPVGACVATERVFEAFKGGREAAFHHGFTYGGHPAGGAAGLANVAIIEREGIVENAARMGARMLERLQALSSHPSVGDVRGLGLMCAVDLVADKATKEPFSSIDGAAKRLAVKLADLGLFTRVRDQVYLSPPLTVTEADVDAMVGIVDEGLTVVERELGLS